MQEGNRGLAIRSIKSFDEERLGGDIQDSIVGLLLVLVGHRHFNPFVGFAPDIATQIAPQQMTLSLEEDHQAAGEDLRSVLF